MGGPGRTRKRNGSSLCNGYLKRSPLQTPQNVLNSIAQHARFADQARFRLVCNNWRDAHRAESFSHRVTVQYEPDWDKTAEMIKRLFPSIIVVVVVDDFQVVTAVLDSPLCDKVLYSSQTDAVLSWQLSSKCAMLDRALDVKDLFSKVQELLDISAYRQRLELRLSLRASHARVQTVQTAIHELQATIRELHVVESLPMFVTSAFPLHHLRALAFTLPYNPRGDYRAAILSLPSLESVHVHANTANATLSVPFFLSVLLCIPGVVTLKVSTLGNYVTLSAASLQHVTNLQLGSGVTIDHVPAVLQHLRLQALHNSWSGMLPVFQELEQLDRRLDLTLDTFSLEALLQLPTNLESLTLLQHLEQPSSDIKQMSDCHSAFSRLSDLKELVIADFVTPYISYVLKGLVFPHVHTLGFCLASAAPNPIFIMDPDFEHVVFSVVSPTPELSFPNLQHVRVYSAVGKPMTPALLYCTWMGKRFLKQLRSVICYYSPFVLTVCDIPDCNIILKPGTQLGI